MNRARKMLLLISSVLVMISCLIIPEIAVSAVFKKENKISHAEIEPIELETVSSLTAEEKLLLAYSPDRIVIQTKNARSKDEAVENTALDFLESISEYIYKNTGTVPFTGLRCSDIRPYLYTKDSSDSFTVFWKITVISEKSNGFSAELIADDESGQILGCDIQIGDSQSLFDNSEQYYLLRYLLEYLQNSFSGVSFESNDIDMRQFFSDDKLSKSDLMIDIKVKGLGRLFYYYDSAGIFMICK